MLVVVDACLVSLGCAVIGDAARNALLLEHLRGLESDAEMARLCALHHQHQQRLSAIGRVLLWRMLRRKLAPEERPIVTRTSLGRPVLAADLASSCVVSVCSGKTSDAPSTPGPVDAGITAVDSAHAFWFNIAHDGDWVALAYLDHRNSRVSIGIDIVALVVPTGEAVSVFLRAMAGVLSAKETQEIDRLEADNERLVRFLSIWAGKEAIIKALGLGIGRMNLAEWTLSPDFPGGTIAVSFREEARHDWKLRLQFLDEGHLLVVALHGSDDAAYADVDVNVHACADDALLIEC